jgi:hypothetical protein
MMKLIGAVLIALMFTSCTAFSPPRTGGSAVWSSDCETVECLMEVYDEEITNNPESTGRRFKWMEGYRDTPLVTLNELGVLKTNKLNPLVPIATGTLGFSLFHSGETGDIADCTVWYTPLIGWKYWLVHEWMHCQGFMESSLDPFAVLLNALQDTYTEEQIRIMSEEGVSHWYDTQFYKNEDATWHDTRR